MIQAQSAAILDVNTTSRIVQFSAILLELGGAVLIASFFAIVGRSAARRAYFTTWTASWWAMVLAIGAVAVRYLLFSGNAATSLPDNAPLVQGLYWLYETGKLWYWLFIWLGVVEHANPPERASARWKVAIGSLIFTTVVWIPARDLNDLLAWQTPIAIACCLDGARRLFSLPRLRRTAGTATTGAVLVATGVLWMVYFTVFASAIGFMKLPLGIIEPVVLNYNSYVDMLMLVMLGYAMLMLCMEDARQRIAGIETRLSSLVMESVDPIFTIDAQRRVVDANSAATRVFGSGDRVERGAPITGLVSTADRERLDRAIRDFERSGEGARLVGDDGLIHGQRGDGTGFTAEFTLSRLYDADVTGISLVVRDVTGRREQEERRRQASTMEAVRQLAGGLAHDFNNLLTTIVGRSQVVARSLPSASAVRDDVTQIEQAAAAAARLSRGLLALSRREPLDPERIAIDDAIRATEPAIRRVIGTRVACSFNLGASDLFAHVDRVRLEGVLLALVQNACEAAPDGGSVGVETTSAVLPQHFGASAEAVCIVVRDNGPGLTAEARAHLFEPFFSTRGDGRGLGLALTWAFAQQSGGSVDVESSPQGTTVRVIFPVAAAPRAKVTTPTGSPPLSIVAEAPRAPRAVLIAEDESSVRKSVRIFLERSGFTVIEASDGIQALAAFERAPDAIGMVLTDVMMPQMGGRELATKLLERRPGLPIVFMSGFLRDPEVLQMVNERRVRFLSKPFDVDALIATVRSEMDSSSTHAA